MKSHIQKWGNSLSLRIPRAFAKEVGLKQDDAVDISLSEGRIIITPIEESSVTLSELLAGITVDNLHVEVDVGLAEGNEAW